MSQCLDGAKVGHLGVSSRSSRWLSPGLGTGALRRVFLPGEGLWSTVKGADSRERSVETVD